MNPSECEKEGLRSHFLTEPVRNSEKRQKFWSCKTFCHLKDPAVTVDAMELGG